MGLFIICDKVTFKKTIMKEGDLDELNIAGRLKKMIMEIAKKELNALVWLGGLLGMLMGFVNLLF